MRHRHESTIQYPGKIMALWTVFLLGTLFHTQLALMPLFHGLSVAESHTHEYANLDIVFWSMLVFFLLPMLAILGAAFYPTQKYRVGHLIMTLVYSVLNLSHFGFDVVVGVPTYQLTLMVVLFLIGLLLNIVSYQWIRSGKHHPTALPAEVS